jgi:DNA-binding transcriptional LysR family regulator
LTLNRSALTLLEYRPELRLTAPHDFGVIVLPEAAHDWIMHPGVLEVWTLPREMTWRFLCDDFFLARDLSRDGAGIVPLPGFVARPYVHEGLLEEVHVGERPRDNVELPIAYGSLFDARKAP